MYKVIWVEALGKKLQAVLSFLCFIFCVFSNDGKGNLFPSLSLQVAEQALNGSLAVVNISPFKEVQEEQNAHWSLKHWIQYIHLNIPGDSVIFYSTHAVWKVKTQQYRVSKNSEDKKYKHKDTKADPVTHKQTDKKQIYHN